MKRYMLPLTILSLVVSFSGVPAHAEENGQLYFAILNSAGVDAETVERVRDYAEKNLYVRVVVENRADSQEGSLSEIGKRFTPIDRDATLAVVALVKPEDPSDSHGVILHEDRVAVVNMTALEAGEVSSEVLERRIQRCVLRSFGFLLGLEYSPIPQSVLYNYKDLAQLDRIGRNYDPPSLVKFTEIAKKSGAHILSYRDLYPGMFEAAEPQ